MRILKFGGSSVATAQYLQGVAAIVADVARRDQVVVVVSALGGVTDTLIEAIERARTGDDSFRALVRSLRRRHLDCQQQLESDSVALARRALLGRRLNELTRLLEGVALLQECSPPVRDRILALGERLSVQLLATALLAIGSDAEVVDGGELIVTDSCFGQASVDAPATRRQVQERLGGLGSTIPVVTGFIGADAVGRPTTLGRGGSDYSASILGAALDADCVEIWTDVDGILSAPPRLSAAARPLAHLSYGEAAELAYFGANVLHPRTMQPLVARGIPIRICNTQRPALAGTLVSAAAPASGRARAITAVEQVTLFTIDSRDSGRSAALAGMLYQILDQLQEEVLLASQASAAGRLLLATAGHRAGQVEEELRRRLRHLSAETQPQIERRDGACLLAAVGRDMEQQPWVAGLLLAALGRRQIPVRALTTGASPHSIAVLVDADRLPEAVALLHRELLCEEDQEPVPTYQQLPAAIGAPRQQQRLRA